MAVDLSDVEVSLGRTLTQAEVAQVLMWIGDARALIGARLGDLALLDQGLLDYVVREAVVARVLRPPGDATQVDVSVDDARVSRRYSSGSGGVSILDEWWDLLSPVQTGRGAFTIRPYGAPDVYATPWPWVQC